MKALKLAMDGKVIEHIIPSFKKIESFLKEWDLGVQDLRELFLAISTILKEHKRYHEDRYDFLFISLSFHQYLNFALNYALSSVCCLNGISAPLRKPLSF